MVTCCSEFNDPCFATTVTSFLLAGLHTARKNFLPTSETCSLARHVGTDRAFIPTDLVTFTPENNGMFIKFRSSRWYQRLQLWQLLMHGACLVAGFIAVLVLQIALMEVLF